MSHRLRYNGACSRQKAMGRAEMGRAEIRGWFMNRQDRANAVDREMSARLMPDAALEALGGWWGQNAVRLTDGTPGAHTVRYTPSRWAHITTWPSMMASTFQAGDADVSRTQVASIVADALERGACEEALVATYVWGKGKGGSPAGSGPATLHKILLGTEGLNAILASVVNTLREQDAEAAYAELRGRIAGFGPSFSPSSCTSPVNRSGRRPAPSRSSLIRSWPGACGRWPRRWVGRPATTLTARSPGGSGGTQTGHRTATRSTSPSCRRLPVR